MAKPYLFQDDRNHLCAKRCFNKIYQIGCHCGRVYSFLKLFKINFMKKLSNLFFALLLCLFSSLTLFAQHGSIELETITSQPAPSTVYGNSTPLAYGVVNGFSELTTAYGIDSMSIPSLGTYRFKLSNPFFGHAVVQATRILPAVSSTNVNTTTTSGGDLVTIFFGDNSGSGQSPAFSFVVYGIPLNTNSGCPIVQSGIGFAQAPNDNLHFDLTDGPNCLDAIPFAILNPTPNVKVVVGNFVSPPATDQVEVTVTYYLAPNSSGSTSTQTINLTSAGATLNLGTHTSSTNLVPYDVNLILTYDGSQFVTAQVVATPQ